MANQNEKSINEVLTGEVVGGELVLGKADVSVFEQGIGNIFTSLKGQTREDNIKLYNTINNSDNSLADQIGVVLEITDMVAHPITLTDDVTGKEVDTMRVVLIAKDGTSYHAVSTGVISSLQKIMQIVGQPTWEPALKIVPKLVKTRNGFKAVSLELKA